MPFPSMSVQRTFARIRDPAHGVHLYTTLSALAYLAVAAWMIPHSRVLVVTILCAIFAGVSLVRPAPHPRGGILEPNSPVILTAALLWNPGEVLLGVGLGSTLGLLFLRRIEPWRAVSNATGWGLSAVAAVLTVNFIRGVLPVGIVIVTLASGVGAAAMHLTTNKFIFGLYRSVRYHRPFFKEWWYGFSWGVLDQFFDLLLAIAAAIVAELAGDISVALAMTAGSAIAVPVSRWYTGLYMDRTMRARADAALERSEQRFRALTAHISDGIALLTADGVVLYLSDSGRSILGHPTTELVGRNWLDLCHPADQEQAQNLLDSVLRSPGTHAVGELRLRHQNGSWRWNQTVYANLTMEPTVQAVVVTYRDISEQKRSEETLEEYAARLRDLSRQLVHAQETERRTIARELHDEIGQVLTGLKLTLEALRQQITDVDALATSTRAVSIVDVLLARVRTLSLNLRPAALDDRGLLPALLLHCNQHMAQGLQAQVVHAGIRERRFPPEIETTAYRIVQEALTNVTRHAGVKEATIRLWADEGILGVQVEDAGHGFVVDHALGATESSGLSGMRERVRLVGGELVVESAPGRGTRVTAELPLKQLEREEPRSGQINAAGSLTDESGGKRRAIEQASPPL